MAQDRALKFSFSAAELDGLEASIQLMILRDARIRQAKGDGPGSMQRFQCLAKRQEHNPLREGHFAPLKYTSTTAQRDRAEEFLHRLVTSAFAGSMPLQMVLAVIEAETTHPYATLGEDFVKLQVDQEARDEVTRAMLIASKAQSQWSKDQTVPVVRAALKAAQDVYSKFWSTALKVVGAGVLATVLGVFAGPLVGGLVGSWLLGLSGAAAVSAGLALLGGGALATGGFGMVGGSVVIAAAFGAAGAGASSMFVGERGDVAARLAAVKNLACFRAVLDLDLLDHQLADDFIVAMEIQTEQYSATKEGKAVAEVFRVAELWLREQYGIATQARRVHRQPRAWREPPLHHVDGIGDLDFRGLVVAMDERRHALENCIAYLRNAHRQYAEVKDADFMRGLWGALSGASRKRLQGGQGHLQDAVGEIADMLSRHQDECARLARAIQKADLLGGQLVERDQVIARYELLAGRMHATISELRGKNDSLKATLETAEERSSRSIAAVAVLLGVYRASAGPRRIGVGEAASEEDGAERRRLVLDLQLLLLLGESGADLRDSVERAASIGISMPDEEEVRATIAALGLPLGSSMSDVNATYRERAAEVHPDRHTRASAPVQKLLEQQFWRLGRAVELHTRYIELTKGRHLEQA